MNSLDDLITSSGIPTSSLAPDVKRAMDRVLQTAGYSALQEVLALLNVRAAQYNGTGTKPATDQAAIDEKALAEALAEVQQRETEKRRERKMLYLTLGGIALLGVGLAVLIIRHKRKQRRNG